MKKNTGSKFRGRGSVLALCLVAASVPLAPSATAQTTANIEFLNPSSFSAVPAPNSPDPSVPKGPDTIIVSDLLTENPDTGDETYRLSAWVSGVPQNPAVEFELLTRGGVSIEIIDDVVRVGSDTFEADWDIPDTLPDGPYTIRATLADGILGIDSASQDIVIQRVADRAEITYPDNRSGTGQYGMFVPLARSANADGAPVQPNPIGNIENRTTGSAPGSGTGRTRAFYTISQPGTKPEWKVCGTEASIGSFPFGGSDNGLRCTLESVGHLQLVTGVALVANGGNTNQPYNASLNKAGDATRVREPYAQVPTKLEVIAGQTATLDSGSCHLVTVELTDQLSREIVGANLDAHAWGPNDRLKFGTGPVDTYTAEAPDRGSHATEDGMDCFSLEEDNPEVGAQGEHQAIGGPDVKHVESAVAGSNDVGQWGFEIFVPDGTETAERHTTYWELWLDEGNDGSAWNNDVYDATELCRSGLIGWGSAASSDPMTGASPSCPNTPPVQTCDPQTSVEPCPGESPSPTPDPTESEQPPQEEDRITIRSSRSRVAKGKRVRFSGAIQTAADECEPGRQVTLQSRRRGGRFRNSVISASMSDGGWSVSRRIRRTTEWRVVAQPVGDCEALISTIVKIRVSRR